MPVLPLQVLGSKENSEVSWGISSSSSSSSSLHFFYLCINRKNVQYGLLSLIPFFGLVFLLFGWTGSYCCIKLFLFNYQKDGVNLCTTYSIMYLLC